MLLVGRYCVASVFARCCFSFLDTAIETLLKTVTETETLKKKTLAERDSDRDSRSVGEVLIVCW